MSDDVFDLPENLDYTVDPTDPDRITYWFFNPDSQIFQQHTIDFSDVSITNANKKADIELYIDEDPDKYLTQPVVSYFIDTKDLDDEVYLSTGEINIDPVIIYLGSDDDNISSITEKHTFQYDYSHVIYGEDGDDLFEVGKGQFFGGAGDDTIKTIYGNGSYIFTGDGNDRVVIKFNSKLVAAGSGDDFVTEDNPGNGAASLIYGESGDDTIEGGANKDTIYGGVDNDFLKGGRHEDSLFGEAGSDLIYGGHGADLIEGGTGNDLIFAEDGSDTIYGGEGNDTIDVGQRATGDVDVVYLGQGSDILYTGGLVPTTTVEGGFDWGSFSAESATKAGVYLTLAAANYAHPGVGNALRFLSYAGGGELIGTFLTGTANKAEKITDWPASDYVTVEDFNPSEDLIVVNTTTEATRDLDINNPSDVGLTVSSDSQGTIGRFNIDHELAVAVAEKLDKDSLNASVIAVKAQMIQRAISTSLIVSYENDELTAKSISGLSYEGEFIDEILDATTLEEGQSLLLLGSQGPGFVSGEEWDTNREYKIYVGGENDDYFIHKLMSSAVFAELASFKGLFYGEDGNDYFDGTGSLGPQRYIGGDGFDTVSFYTTLWSFSDGLEVRGLTVDISKAEASNIRHENATFAAFNTAYFEEIEGLVGSKYNDHLTGNESNNIIEGVDGNDTIFGADGDDLLIGGADRPTAVEEGEYYYARLSDNDVLSGDAGNDTLIGGRGIDTLLGGTGDDLLVVSPELVFTSPSVLDGGANFDIADFLAVAQSLIVKIDTHVGIISTGETSHLLYNLEGIVGGGAGDRLYGNDSANYIAGGGGSDKIWGEGGDDTLEGAEFSRIYGGKGADLINGGREADTIEGNAGDDTIDGEGGNDLITGGTDDDSIMGGGGADTIHGEAGHDVIDGGLAGDLIFGEQGKDTIDGGDGNDTIDGGASADSILGGAGNDLLTTDAFTGTHFDGGDDTDTLTFAAIGEAVTLDLSSSSATAGNATDTFINVETIVLTDLDDVAHSHTSATGGTGTTTIDFGDGFDIFNVEGSINDFTITKTGRNELTLARAGGETVVVQNAERISFVDSVGTTDDAPIAPIGAFVIAQGATISANIDAIDDLVDGGALTYAGIGTPDRGASTVDAAGNFTYTGGSAFFGTDRFYMSVTDDTGNGLVLIPEVTVVADRVDISDVLPLSNNPATIAALADGGMVALVSAEDGAYTSPYVRIIDADGTVGATLIDIAGDLPDGVFHVHTEVFGLSDGGFVAFFTRGAGSAQDVYARFFDAAGNATTASFAVASVTDASQTTGGIAELADGTVQFVWASSIPDLGTEVRSRIFDTTGTAVSDEMSVNTTGAGADSAPRIAILEDGTGVVVWFSSSADGDGGGIYARRLDADGNAIGAEFRVNTTTAGAQTLPDVAAMPGGGFAVVWQGDDTSGHGIFAQVFDANGLLAGSEIRVNNSESGDQADPRLTAVASGDVVVSFFNENDYTARYRVLSPDGVAVGDEEILLTGTAFTPRPAVTTLADGRVATIAGTDISILTGPTTAATPYRDFVADGEFSSVFAGSAGADQIDGGDGVDTMDFSASDEAITVNLQTGATSGTDAAGDVYASIENLIGSGFADSLGGDAADNTITGGAGNDTITGGSGTDTAVFSGALSGYSFTVLAGDGVVLVADINTADGDDGTDRVALDVEFFRFAGTTIGQDGFVNDPALVTGDTTLAINETDAQVVGTLVVADPDTGQSSMQQELLFGTYGQAFIAANGEWSYSPTADLGFLALGESITDTFEATTLDGTSVSLTVTIHGENTAAVLSDVDGEVANAIFDVGEDVSSATIEVTVTDVDDADATLTSLVFHSSGTTSGIYGDIALSGDGNIVLTPNEDAQSLKADYVERVNWTSNDGTTGSFLVRWNGIDDAPLLPVVGTAPERSNGSVDWSAGDIDGSIVSFEITGGADMAAFGTTLVAGEAGLRFVSGSYPDYEAPSDADLDGIYELELTATDDTGNTTVEMVSIAVTNTNDAPERDFERVRTVYEGSLQTGIVPLFTDPEGTDVSDPDTWSFLGDDIDALTFDPVTGQVFFNIAPDFENPHDDNVDNRFVFNIRATDGELQSTGTFIVIDILDAPAEFTGLADLSVAENVETVGQLSAVHEDGGTFAFMAPEEFAATYSVDSDFDEGIIDLLANGADNDKVAIGLDGTLTITGGANYEARSDADGDNVYAFRAVVYDTASMAYQVRDYTLAITDVDEIPEFISAASVTMAENETATGLLPATDVATTIALDDTVLDTDNDLFALVDGELVFLAAPDYETPGDVGTDNVYTVALSGTHGSLGTGTQLVSVTVTDVNEAPYDIVIDTPIVLEEQAGATIGSLSATYLYDLSAIAYTLDPASEATFAIDGTTLRLAPGVALDFESVGDTVDVTIVASDGTFSTTETLSITIAEIDEAPLAGADVLVTNEDTPATITVADILANDSDAEGLPLTVTEVSAADGTAVLTSDGDTGEPVVLFTPVEDFNGETTITYTVSDGTRTAEGTIAVTVNAVDDGPASGIALTNAAVDENDTGAIVGELSAIDPDGAPITFSVTDSRFVVDGTTLRLADGVALDFETEGPVIDLDITANDGVSDAVETLAITVGNVNELPTGGAFATATDEDVPIDIAVADILANHTDPDGDTLTITRVNNPRFGSAELIDTDNDGTYDIVRYTSPDEFSGTDPFSYTVSDGQGGTVDGDALVTVNLVNDLPEAVDVDLGAVVEDNTFAIAAADLLAGVSDIDSAPFITSLVIQSGAGSLEDDGNGGFIYTPAEHDDTEVVFAYTASDGENAASALATLDITPVADAPIFTSAEANTVIENETTAYIPLAFDPEGSDIVYSLSGTDAGLFTLTEVGGETQVAFLAAPDHEAPADANGDNVYEFVVTARDDTAMTTDQAVAVTVTDVIELALDVDVVASHAENTTGIVATSSATDTVGVATFALGGVDAARFSIDSTTGTVAFLAAPDFEAPGDDDTDGRFDLTITVSDESGASVAKDIVVALADVAETPLAFDDAAVLEAYDDALTLSVLANDIDPDLDADLTVTAIDDSGTVGSVSIASDGKSILYDPGNAFAFLGEGGTSVDTFSYTVTDEDGLSDTATVSLTVTGEPDIDITSVYVGATLASRTWVDNGDVRNWQMRTKHYDEAGDVTRQLLTLDSGQVHDSTFEERELVRKLVNDPLDDFGFTTKESVFTDGVLSWQELVFDNGNEQEKTYADGKLASLKDTDTAGLKPWASVTRLFDDTGDLVGKTTVYDDGDISEKTYEDGKEVGDTTTDLSGDKNWFTRELTYDVDGELTNKTLTYDDGDILEQQYVDGYLATRIETDVTDQHDWYSLTQTYDELGRVTSTSYVYDDASA